MERKDLAEFGEKRITDHDFPPIIYGRKIKTRLSHCKHIRTACCSKT